MNDVFRAQFADEPHPPEPPPTANEIRIERNPYRPTMHGQSTKPIINWILAISAILFGLVGSLLLIYPASQVVIAIHPDRQAAADIDRGMNKIIRTLKSLVSE